MPLYRVAKEKLEAVKQTSFIDEKFFERRDLQRLLKADISVIGDDLMVIAEEFGEWDESSRRIDLLCSDKQARLVVVEIKRTEDGGHMELQAIRYAAMVSSMTLDQTIAAYARSLRQEIFRRFWAQFIERSKSKTALYANRSTSPDQWISCGIGRSGFSLNTSVTEDRTRIECYISMGKDSDAKNKTAFLALLAQKNEIENSFGGVLDWQELPGRIGCRICFDTDGGWKTSEADWADLQDRVIAQMVKLESALKGPIQGLKI